MNDSTPCVFLSQWPPTFFSLCPSGPFFWVQRGSGGFFWWGVRTCGLFLVWRVPGGVSLWCAPVCMCVCAHTHLPPAISVVIKVKNGCDGVPGEGKSASGVVGEVCVRAHTGMHLSRTLPGSAARFVMFCDVVPFCSQVVGDPVFSHAIMAVSS